MKGRHEFLAQSDPIGTDVALDAPETIRMWKKFLGLGVPRVWAKNERPFLQGTPAVAAFLLERGLVKLWCTLPNGDETIVALRFPGELIEGWACVLQIPREFSATTLTECELHRVEARRLHDLARNGGEAAMLLLRSLSMGFYRTCLDVVDLKTLTARQRLEKLMLQVEQARPGEKFSECLPHHVPLRDAEMAALLGVSPEYLSRTKKTLHRRRRAA